MFKIDDKLVEYVKFGLIITFVSFILFIGSLLTTGGDIGDLIATISFESLGIFTLILIGLGVFITDIAIDDGIKQSEKAEKPDDTENTTMKEKTLLRKYNSLNDSVAQDNLVKYNKENIEKELKTRRDTKIKILEDKRKRFVPDSKRYNKLTSKIEKWENKHLKPHYKSFRLHDLTIKTFKTKANIEDRTSVTGGIKQEVHRSGLTKSIITKFLFAGFGTAGAQLFISGDKISAIITTIVYLALFTWQYISLSDSVRKQRDTTWREKIGRKEKIIDLISGKDKIFIGKKLTKEDEKFIKDRIAKAPLLQQEREFISNITNNQEIVPTIFDKELCENLGIPESMLKKGDE
jgi:hypothetical protein